MKRYSKLTYCEKLKMGSNKKNSVNIQNEIKNKNDVQTKKIIESRYILILIIENTLNCEKIHIA